MPRLKKPDDDAPVSSKLIEAKRLRLPKEGKAERISKALAALSQPPSIQLTRGQWQAIAEDADAEDQSS